MGGVGDYQHAVRLEAAIVALTRDATIWEQPTDVALPALLRGVASALDVERVSIWRLVDGGAAIECSTLFERTIGRFSSGTKLAAAEHPAYFRAVREADVIPASDARNDERTREFRDGYLVPLDIHAMLDAPIVVAGELVGILCHEHVGGPRTWTTAEIHFAVWAGLVVARRYAGEAAIRAAAEHLGLERHLVALAEASRAGIVSTHLGGRIHYANPAARMLFGADLAGRMSTDFLPTGLGPNVQLSTTGASPILGRTVAREYVREDGAPLLVEVTTSVFDAGGERYVGFIGRDISEAEQRFRATFADAPVGVAHVAFDGAFLRVNKQFCELVGADEAALRPYRRATDVDAPPDERGPGFETVVRAEELGLRLPQVRAGLASGRTPFTFEQHFDRDGHPTTWVELRISLAHDLGGQPVHFVCFAHDVTARRRSGDAIRILVTGTTGTGDAFSRSLVRSLAVGLGTRGAVVAELHHGPVPSARTVAVWRDGDLVPDIELPLVGSPLEVVIATGRCFQRGGAVARFPGCSMLAALGADTFLGVRLDDRAGRPIGIVAVLHDGPLDETLRPEDVLRVFAARAAAELDARHAASILHERDETLRQLSESLEDAVWLVSTIEGSPVVYVSPSYERMYGRPKPAIGGSIEERLEFAHPDDRARVRLAFAAPPSEPVEITYRLLAADGTVRWLRERAAPVRDASGTVRRRAGIAQDVTRIRDAEDALRDSEHRLAAALRISEDNVHALREQLGERPGLVGLLGASEPMQEVYQRVRLAAERDVTVLLTGESGTGKELAAAAIHALSARRDRPFIGINCAAIPESLLESELFGHVRGAFTGAVRDKVGLLQSAHGGTLLLDEIGEVPPSLQVKLLRALETRQIRRVGDERPIAIDVRLVSATHRDLRALVAAGRFREDFYYRIRVFEIELPPLRARRDDIPALAAHFVSMLGKTAAPVRLGADALRALMQHSWPGNVRELRNAVEHALVTVQGDVIRAHDLPIELTSTRPPRPASATPAAAGPEEERARIEDALREAGGNRSEAARRLGISRVTLWKRLRRLGLVKEGDE